MNEQSRPSLHSCQRPIESGQWKSMEDLIQDLSKASHQRTRLDDGKLGKIESSLVERLGFTGLFDGSWWFYRVFFFFFCSGSRGCRRWVRQTNDVKSVITTCHVVERSRAD